jgi:hypothetical protein
MFKLISIGLALLTFTIATYEIIKLRKFLRTGIKAKGRRVGFKLILDSDNEKIEVPVLEFLDPKNGIIKTKIDTNIYNRKSEIDIIYNPAIPKIVIVDNWTMHVPWLFPLTFGVLSLIFLMIEY